MNWKDSEIEEYKRDFLVYESARELLDRLEKTKAELLDRRKTIKHSLVLYLFSTVVVLSVFFFVGKLDFFSSLVISIYVGAFLWLMLLEIDWIVNIFTLGNFSKLNLEIQELDSEIGCARRAKESAHVKLEPFEKSVCEQYRTQLEHFFEENLFRKRSGTERFERALVEFAELIDEVTKINSNFVTQEVALREYKDYLSKRKVNHELRASKDSSEVVAMRNFTRRISEREKIKPVETIAPERKFRTAKKIDNWEEINRKRKLTGSRGEEIVVALEQEFLESINRKDLSDKVRHVSLEEGDGLGYDILSFFQDGKKKFIEVKSTTMSLGTAFYISRNELDFLKEHGTDGYIYRVLVASEPPEIQAHSGQEFLEMSDLVPTQYQVKLRS